MKASGKKFKGARLERKVSELLRRSGLDKTARRSFGSGNQWGWKSDIYTSLNYAIECKNQEKVRLWEFWEQAESQRKPYKPPVLMVSANYRPILAIMNINDWINLVLENEDLRKTAKNKIISPDK